MIPRPSEAEYHAYYAGYVGNVPDGDILAFLQKSGSDMLALIGGLSAEQGDYRYAEGKWSIKELLIHMMDSERVFAYRALACSRGDLTQLPGFEQDDYVPTSEASRRTVESIQKEYAAVRAATIALFASMSEEQWSFAGNANGSPITARALAWIMAGHEQHHQRILKERYL